MTRATSWGRQIAAVVPALVAGCAGAAKPEPVSEPRPVASVEPVASGPAMVASVGSLVPVLASSETQRAENSNAFLASVRYGRGVLRMAVDYGYSGLGSLTWCRLKGSGDGICVMYSVSTTGQAPRDDDWPGRPEPPGVTTTKMLQSPQYWASLSPGRDGVYAYAPVLLGKEGRGSLQRIDERGGVTTWIDGDGLPSETSDALVLEVDTRRFVMVVTENSRAMLAAVREGKPGDKTTVGPWSPLPMAPIRYIDPAAYSVRMVTDSSEKHAPGTTTTMAMVGAPVALSLRGASKDEWALVWIEGVAPPKSWPPGKPWKSPRRSRHACGPSSRSVDDVSVDKRLHLTRMRDTKVVSDVVLRSDSTIEPQHALQVRAVEKGVEVDGVTYSLAGKELGGKVTPTDKALGRWPMPPGREERVGLLAFDAGPGGSGQGIVIVRAAPKEFRPSGEEQWLRTFDAKGAFVGEPVKVLPTIQDPGPDDTSLNHVPWDSAVRQGDRWVLSEPTGQYLLIWPGGVLLELPRELEGASLVKVGDRAHLATVGREEMVEADVDVGAGKVSTPVRRAFEPLPGSPRELMALDDSRTPTWLTVAATGDKVPGETVWKLRPGASRWEAAGVSTTEARQRYVRLLASWSGPVANFLDQQRTPRLHWLRTGQERDAGLETFTGGSTDDPLAFPTDGRWRIVPSEPGPLAVSAADPEQGDCSQPVATGPRSAVVACLQLADPLRFNVIVGLRSVTLGP